MAITSFVNNKTMRENASKKAYASERNFRADVLIENWSRVPGIGEGLMDLDEATARNTAINLQQEASVIKRVRENAQLSTAFAGQTPENMLRLTRMAMPSAIRNEVFTNYALESMNDSIKYLSPVVQKNFKGTNNMKDRHSDGFFGGAADNMDPFNMEGSSDFNDPNYQKPLYETNDDRFVQELANAMVVDSVTTAYVGNKEVTVTAPAEGTVLKYIVCGKTDASASSPFDLGYINGYTTIFGADEKDTIAIQDKSGKFFTNQKDHPGVDVVECGEGVFALIGTADSAITTVKAYGRYDSESDFEGDNLGQIALRMATYRFNPRPITLGISFSQLSDVALDVSFGVSVEEELLNYGAQFIKASLDRQAFKLAYHEAKTNPDNFRVTFNAGYQESDDENTNIAGNQKRGYIENAQTFMTAVHTVSDKMMVEMNRGGVSRMVGGPSAVTYTSLVSGFKPASSLSFNGPHKFGELNNIPVYKVSSDIIPTDEILCIWKNEQQEGDVAVVFGTLVPFISTGIIPYANFNSRAGIASIGDYRVLRKNYLSIIKIENLKDSTAK